MVLRTKGETASDVALTRQKFKLAKPSLVNTFWSADGLEEFSGKFGHTFCDRSHIGEAGKY